MRPEQPKGELAKAIGALVELEEQFKANARAIDPKLEPRIYEWHPSKPPETPCVWNEIEPSVTEKADTDRLDDVLAVKVVIGVTPSDIGENSNRLVRLTDVFRATVDPALDEGPPLGGTVVEAKRTVTRTEIVWFPNDIPVLCMAMSIQMRLRAAIR